MELGYAEIAYSPTIASSTSALITGLELADIVVDGKPLLFTFTCPQGVESTVDGDVLGITLVRDSTPVKSVVARVGAGEVSFWSGVPFRDDPADGTYDYSLWWARLSGSGTCRINYTGSPFYCLPWLRCEDIEVAP